VKDKAMIRQIIFNCAERAALKARNWMIRDRLARAGVPGARKVFSFTSYDELYRLYLLARGCPQGTNALEIGSYLGKSSCFILAGLQGGTLTCVDTWQNETMPEGERSTYDEFLKNVGGARARLRIVRKRSNELTSADISGPYSLIFLDGDHSYAATKGDFEQVTGWLAPGGIIAFHDSTNFEGVSRSIGEALVTGRWQMIGLIGSLIYMRRAEWPRREWLDASKETLYLEAKPHDADAS
jgi:predicted O-methyltransferase YrrM